MPESGANAKHNDAPYGKHHKCKAHRTQKYHRTNAATTPAMHKHGLTKVQQKISSKIQLQQLLVFQLIKIVIFFILPLII